jgi:homoserine dehydrogenase
MAAIGPRRDSRLEIIPPSGAVPMQSINIGLLGCGTVGTGVVRLLHRNAPLIRNRLGADLVIRRVADLDPERDRGLELEADVWTRDARQVIDDPDVNIVIEMIGGETIAKELILRAIARGKPIITANKALLASQGNELIRAAAEAGVDMAFEASVGGCMPIIKTLRESLAGNHIRAMTGILNGTCNYILTRITAEGQTFAEALAAAQDRGYAEADPALDVEGLDTAHKLAILSALAYGMEINLDDIYIEGISKITPLDIAYAEQFGYRIKLLAISKHADALVEARVHPTMIPWDNLLSKVDGTVNAVTVSTDAAGDILLHGRGAGMMPTASAVISDAVDIARNLLAGSTGRIPLLSYQKRKIRQIPIMPIEALETQYYFRFFAKDRPGVLSKIAGILGNYQISIKSVHQKGRKTDGSVPLVMFSHQACEADVRAALAEIASLDVVSAEPMLIRIEDDSAEA